MRFQVFNKFGYDWSFYSSRHSFVKFYLEQHKRDLFVFLSGSLIGFLVEWYGISREIWSYPHGQQLPPLLMIIAWGLVSLAIVHLALIFNFIEQKEEHRIRKWLKKKGLTK